MRSNKKRMKREEEAGKKGETVDKKVVELEVRKEERTRDMTKAMREERGGNHEETEQKKSDIEEDGGGNETAM